MIMKLAMVLATASVAWNPILAAHADDPAAQTVPCCGTKASTTSGAAHSSSGSQPLPCCDAPKKSLVVDYLYLDMTTCERCQSADSSLKEALGTMSGTLDALGYAVKLNEVNIASRELAAKYRFVSSPTIHVNGIDIFNDVDEGDCTHCGTLSGGSVDCRVFMYEGKEYEQPPVAMIVDGIMRNLHKSPAKRDEPYTLPDNLEKFFSGVESSGCSSDSGCIPGTTAEPVKNARK
jgi:hypothetical protein